MSGLRQMRRGDAETDQKPFVEHLEDLRRTLIAVAVCLVVGLVIAIPLAPSIVTLLKMPLAAAGEDPAVFLRVIRVGDGFSVAMQVVFWSGVLISLPGMLIAVAGFVFPGLTARERRTVTRAVAIASALFVVGVTVGYMTSLPVAISWLLNINRWIGIQADFVELADYCTFVLKLLIAFGLVFELPVVVVALGLMGLVGSRAMRDRRRHVVVGLMALAMFMTPPDPLTMILMSAPLVLLYEVCIWIVWLQERRRKT
jgi:sec-independent protein translocase protein TatC